MSAAKAELELYRVRFWKQPQVGRKLVCSRCGEGGYGSRTSSGKLCIACVPIVEAEVLPSLVATADLLAAAYGLDERGEAARVQLCESLASSDGQIRVQLADPQAVRMRLRFTPSADPAPLVASLERHQVGLQAQTVGRALWGLTLQVSGQDLVSLYRKDGRGGHYAPYEIPWSVVAWARQSLWAARWLQRYARQLSARYVRLFGREHRSISSARLGVYDDAIESAHRHGFADWSRFSNPFPRPGSGIIVEAARLSAQGVAA